MADLKVKVGIDKSGFTTGLASMENSVKGFGNKVGGILAGAFAFDKIIQGFSTAIEKGDQLQDLANRFGIAASSLQMIGNAASLSGAGLEDVASAMNKLAKNAGEAVGGNNAMAEAFAKIGLSVADLKGMSPQDLFMALSKAVASGSLGMQDFSVAMQLAGKGAGALMETFRMGADAITENGQAMGVWSDETILQLSKASDAMKTLQNTFVIGFGYIAQAINPVLDAFKQFTAEVTLVVMSLKNLASGDLQSALADFNAMKESHAQSLKLKEDKVAPLRVVDESGPSLQKSTTMSTTIPKADNKNAALVPKIEDLQAKREGTDAQIKLLEERATAASAKARSSGGAQDVFDAQKLAVDLQNSLEQRMKEAGFGQQSLSRAKSQTDSIVGAIPQASQLLDIPSSTEAQRVQPVKLENPPDLAGINDKLETLIKKAGVFS